MKKLIIALSAMAIASFNITPVSAQLVDEGEMYKAREYLLWTQKQNRNIYTNYDIEATMATLGANTCKHKDLSKALDILKENDYSSFVVTILNFYENGRLLRLMKLSSDILCPEVKDIKF
jgi:hypothetical protein